MSKGRTKNILYGQLFVLSLLNGHLWMPNLAWPRIDYINVIISSSVSFLKVIQGKLDALQSPGEIFNE